MKRLAYRMNPGSIANLKAIEEELPDPGPGEAQVALKAIGLNFADLYTVWGMYEAAPDKDFVPGLEYAGTVESVGEGVTNVKPGDRVMGITRFGAYVDRLNIDSSYLVHLPGEWSFDEGAAYIVQTVTAYYALVELARIRAGETVLIHSAAGGVGLQANRIAKKYGAYTIGSVGSEKKLPLLKEEDYDKGIVRSGDFRQDLRAALDGRDLNIIMECIGGKILMDGFKELAVEGRMVVYGSASFTTPGDRPNKLKMLWRYLRRPKIDPMKLPPSNRSLLGFNLIWLYPQKERFARVISEMMDLDIPRPFVGETFPFKQLPDAIRLLQSGQTMGKVVVVVGSR